MSFNLEKNITSNFYSNIARDKIYFSKGNLLNFSEINETIEDNKDIPDIENIKHNTNTEYTENKNNGKMSEKNTETFGMDNTILNAIMQINVHNEHEKIIWKNKIPSECNISE